MKHIGLVFILATLLAVALVAGCMSAPEGKANAAEVESATITESSNAPQTPTTENNSSVRYVELHGIDGVKAGGRYVSESAAFVTIDVLYVIDEHGFLTEGNGKTIGFKTAVISSMVDIPDPSAYINATLKAQEEKAEADKIAEQKAAEEKAAYYAEQREKLDAEQAKYQPTG